PVCMSEIQAPDFSEVVLADDRPRLAVGGASATAILAALAVAKLLLQFAGIRNYGFFRDELYYMACGEHLAWGYVDQPPLIALIAWIARHTMGDSMLALRLLPALSG